MNELISSTSHLTTPTVQRIGLEGDVLCGDAWCDRLHGPVPLDLAIGDVVLACWIVGRERGIVVGRIGGEARAPAAARVPSETVVAAKTSLELRCGDASLTMRADGRILISGSDIVSRAKRRNRIKGGSVAIN